ncbi:hypothetical protein PUN28_005067 [Cardiocondyla obscurior]|uniref:Uncharacterized protein n=1 Tax=Cardiocondyla obscurior TaxID=286306 RepID=A0AAW2GEK1_9HYME
MPNRALRNQSFYFFFSSSLYLISVGGNPLTRSRVTMTNTLSKKKKKKPLLAHVNSLYKTADELNERLDESFGDRQNPPEDRASWVYEKSICEEDYGTRGGGRRRRREGWRLSKKKIYTWSTRTLILRCKFIVTVTLTAAAIVRMTRHYYAITDNRAKITMTSLSTITNHRYAIAYLK